MRKLNEKNLRNILTITIIISCSIFAICISFIQYLQYHNPIKITTDINKSNKYKYYDISKESFHYALDIIDDGMWYRTLKGWVFKDNNSITSWDTRLVIYNETTNIGYAFYTNNVKRTDVTKVHGKDTYNYDASGFQTRIDANYFKKGYIYKLGFILYDMNGNYEFFLTDKTLESTDWRNKDEN